VRSRARGARALEVSIRAARSRRDNDDVDRHATGGPAMLNEPVSDAVLEAESRSWWVYLITGALWIIFGFIVLSARTEITTVWAVAIYAGILFFLVGVGELTTAFMVSGWKWLHAIFGVIAIIAGIFAFAWPGQTFVTLAVILAWYLLFDGIFQIVAAFYARG